MCRPSSVIGFQEPSPTSCSPLPPPTSWSMQPAVSRVSSMSSVYPENIRSLDLGDTVQGGHQNASSLSLSQSIIIPITAVASPTAAPVVGPLVCIMIAIAASEQPYVTLRSSESLFSHTCGNHQYLLCSFPQDKHVCKEDRPHILLPSRSDTVSHHRWAKSIGQSNGFLPPTFSYIPRVSAILSNIIQIGLYVKKHILHAEDIPNLSPSTDCETLELLF